MTDLIQVLEERSCLTDKGLTFIESSDCEEFISYRDLYDSARRALAGLSQKGIRPGDELVFQIEENRSFVIVFWACILGGIIPVPLTIGRTDDHKLKLFNVWAILNNPFLITSGEKEKIGDFAAAHGLTPVYQRMESQSIDLAGLLSCRAMGEVRRVRPDDIAFIQFSSGSTGQPKGVVLTHKNLLTNIRAISMAACYSPEDIMSSWMPLTHDMGLIGFHLNPVYCGIRHQLMPPAVFMRRPALWLDKATEHKVSILCSPNFGYQYLIKHCFADADRYKWDLSRVRLVYNGAEPVSERLCRDFLRHLEPYGLKSHAMCPVYGLAEASVAVSISGLQDEVISIAVDRTKAGPGDTIAPCLPGRHSLSFVNVGTPVNECAIRIADQEDRPLGENIIGHLQMKGENVTSGYYNNAKATKEAFTADGWFRTGDLAFLRAGAVYITGRAKDIIFSNGQNYYPHDLERIAQEVEGIELNKIVIAGFFNHETERDEIAAFVLHRDVIETFLPIALSLQAVINSKTGLHIDRIIPVKDIPRTTSGKLQRFRLVEQLNNGGFESIEPHLQLRPAGPAAFPENETEDQLLEIWRRVLDNERIAADQHFFEAGGNSLKAAEVAMLVRKAFGVDLSPDILYIKPTVRALAVEICNRMAVDLQDGDLGVRREAVFVPLPVATESAEYPLSSAQKRIYYACELQWPIISR
jgi:surfactin family lipopeptide synthetase A